MELTQQRDLPVPQADVWDSLNDTGLLQMCIPGCESLTPDGEDAYAVALVAAVGPVRARFKGRLRIEEKSPPQSYRLQFEGQGGAAGFGKGHAEVRLEPNGRDTVLHYTAHASVGGKLAQIGSRLVDMAAQKMANEFFARFTAELQARYPAQADAEDGGAHTEPAEDQSTAARPSWTKRLLGKISDS